jgi:hypothetical protein
MLCDVSRMHSFANSRQSCEVVVLLLLFYMCESCLQEATGATKDGPPNEVLVSKPQA